MSQESPTALRKKELKLMKAKELRSILKKRNVSYSDCLEKSDFIKRIMETDGQEPKSSSRERTIADSTCIVVENCQSDYDVAIIICHGYGANEKDMASIGDELMKSPALKKKKVRFIFPRAPVEVEKGHYAWWPLDFQALMMKGLTMGIDKVFDGPTPSGVDAALKGMLDLIEVTKKQTNLPTSKIIVGGFSQGSWLMTDVMFSLKESLGGLVVYSGALFRKEKWTKLTEKRKGIKIIQTHGEQDMMLPALCGSMLTKFFKENKMDVDFFKFQGQHNIPEEGIKKLHDMICAVIENS